MKVSIITIGKLKEKYLTDGVQEFVKRLKPYCSLEIIELAENNLPDNFSEAQLHKHLEIEGEKILKNIADKAYVFLLDLHGKQLSSQDLSEKIQALGLDGRSHLVFVIGGAFGVGENLRARADFAWSFSKLTFTHQMIRMLLVEQIYRAFKIAKGEKYHW